MPLQFGDIYVPENFNTEFAPIKEKIENLSIFLAQQVMKDATLFSTIS